MSSRPADVLIVDDEPEICVMLSEALAGPERNCVTVGSGRQAFDLLARSSFDAVISDVSMPDMDGLELLARSRVVRPDCPVILITGVGTTEWAKDAIRKGAFDYIEKPFELDHLRGVLDRALANGRDRALTVATALLDGASSRDPVTDLPTHRRFLEELGTLRARCRRTNRPLSVLLVDVDEFRSVNDCHGHACGDRVLHEVARRLVRSARESDVVARYGWDQFVLALPDTAGADAVTVADRCVDMIRRSAFAIDGHELNCTVSVGAAECESGFIENEANLLRRAGEALAAAKNRGGNIVVHWDEVASPDVGALAPEADSLRAMRNEFQRLQQQLKQSYLDSTRALVAAVEAKDPYTEKHSLTVAHYAMAFARHLGLPVLQMEAIGTAAILHDVGKIGIPDSILTKPGKLEPEEYELIKRHPVMGAQILEHIRFLKSELPFILHHHERWDGRGYPAGLAGEAIPLGARVLHIADATDAMLSARAYKPGFTLDRAIGELQRGAGRQFDPALTEAFLDWIQLNPGQIVSPNDRDRVLPNLMSIWNCGSNGQVTLAAV